MNRSCLTLLSVGLALVTTAVAAHPLAKHEGKRHLLGIHRFDPTVQPTEDWGTYCVTELAPVFREAVAMNISAGLSPAPHSMAQLAQGGDLTPVSDTTEPQPPSMASAPSQRITVFVAKRFVTMDPGWPEATAVAVMDGKILSVGVTFDDLKPWLDRYPYEVDDRFKDKVVYPGFVEAHTHPVMGSLALSRPSLSYFPMSNPYGPDIPGVKTREEALTKLKEFVAAAKSPDETVLTWGYDILAMGEDFDRKQLDAISASQPLIVWDASEHYAYANSAALKKYGITEAKIKGVTGAGTYPDGSSDGKFLGTDAARLILPAVIAEQMTPASAARNLTYFSDLMQQAGVTTAGDLFFGGVNMDLEQELSKSFFATDASHQRIVHVIDGFTANQLYGDKALETAQGMQAQATDKTMFKGVKFYADDAFVSLGMDMQWPGYVDPQTYKGLFMYESTEAFIEAMKPWWNAGFSIHVHSNGSGGNQITLDALAALQEQKPRFDHRFTFEHFGISTVAQGRRVKALGAVVSTNPYYVYERADLTAAQIGTDRASLAARMRSLIDQDIVVSLHSDTPVGVPSPLLEVWTAVNRIGFSSGKVHAPFERVDVERAMKMVTIDAAYTLGVEDKIGTIEAGKLADFTVLSEDPMDVDPMKIRDIAVEATILGGNVTLTAETRTPPK
ncbi:MAG: amidohydrolase [Rhodobacteraceae bacterium]|nr:amidohydrolase [Paracoccaceae bacterium]